MRILLFRISLFMLVTITSTNLVFAQKNTIKGQFFDDTNAPLEAVSVVLLTLPDSIPTDFLLSDSLGNFRIKSVPEGHYRLLGTYLGYVPFSQEIEMIDKLQIDLGKITLQPTIIGLGVVEITEKATPVIIRNDTVFYNAGSFVTRPNASVMELLKLLPGLEIDRDGNIKTQGKTVINILVDGKPFFNGDQGTTTKVLPADAIQTIEVYDQTSKQADFSGVNDGGEEKTINLILKEDRKKGWFGNAEVSGGGSKLDEQRHELSASANRFTPKRQFAVLGNLSNLSPAGGTNGYYRSSSGGLNFYKGDDDNNSTAVSYQFNGNAQVQNAEVSRQLLLQDGGILTNEKTSNGTDNSSHSLSFNKSYAKDTTVIFYLGGSISLSKSTSIAADTSNSFNSKGKPLNTGLRKNTDQNDANNANIDMLWGRRLKKKNQTVTFNIAANRSDNTNTGTINALNTFFDSTGVLARTDTIRQLNDQKEQNNNFSMGIDYTTNLNKKNLLQLEYGADYLFQRSEIAVKDLVFQEQRPNDSLSSIFDNQIGNQTFGLNLQHNGKKWELNGELGAQLAHLKSNTNKITQVPINKTFLNVLGGISANRQLGENQNISINYHTDASQPNSEQLQPVPDQSDPLNVHYGNPNLRPEYNHRTSFNFQKYHPTRMSSFFTNFELGYTQNKIMEIITIKDGFVRHYKPQNTPGSYAASFGMNYSRSVWKNKASYFFSLNGQWSRGQLTLNDRLNTTENTAISPSANFHYSPKKWLSMNISASFSKSGIQYSLDKALAQRFTNQSYNTGFNLRFPKKFYLDSDLSVNVSKGRSAGFNRTIPIWNISFSRNFMKSESLQVSLRVSDVLNKNVGLNRSTSLNYIEDRKTAIISRYILLKVSYLFRQV